MWRRYLSDTIDQLLNFPLPKKATLNVQTNVIDERLFHQLLEILKRGTALVPLFFL